MPDTEVVLSIAGRCGQAENEQKLPLSPPVSLYEKDSKPVRLAAPLEPAEHDCEQTNRFSEPSIPVHECNGKLILALIRCARLQISVVSF